MSEEKMRKTAKMFGYLERRGKMSITGRWKRWWCVLEGHLLLYYKSQKEYLKLSPCCGSLNIALVRSIQPNIDCQLHILTHSQLVILRTRTKEKQQQWFHALVGVLPRDDHQRSIQNTFSFTSLDLHRKSEKIMFQNQRKSFVENGDKKIENYSAQKCYNNLTEETENYSLYDSLQTKEENKIILNEIQNIKEIKPIRNNISHEIQLNSDLNSTQIRKCSSYCNINDLKCKTEFQMKRKSNSCDCICCPSYNYSSAINDVEYTISNKMNEYLQDESEYALTKENLRGKILRKRTRQIIINKRPLNFLKNILQKRNHKYTKEEVNKHYLNTPKLQQICEENLKEFSNLPLNYCDEMQSKQTEINSSEILERLVPFPTENETNLHITLTSICATTDTVKTEEDKNWAISSNMLPELPVKKVINSQNFSLQKNKEEFDIYKEVFINEDKNKNLMNSAEVDNLLLQLTVLNKKSNNLSDSDSEEDPDYDIPRPHLPSISKLDSGKILINSEEHSDNSYESLNCSRFNQCLSFDITPDSLEMPWLSNECESNINYWSTVNDYHFYQDNSESDNDKYQDSLNPIKHNL